MLQSHNILFLTRALVKLQERYLEGIRKTHGLSQVEITIITFLHNNPGHDTASDIADTRMLQRGNVSQGVESLIQKSFLARTPDAHDRRRIHLSLTKGALPIVREVEQQQKELLKQVFFGFSQEDLQMYTGLNERMMDNILAGLERK